MAQLYLKIHQIYRFIQIGGIITNMWPNDPKKGKLTLILKEIVWYFTFLNVLVIEMSFMCVIYKYWSNVTTTMTVLSQFFEGLEILFNLLIFKLKRTRIQSLLKEIEDFLLNSNDIERTILQKYTNRYFCFSVFVVICNCSAAIIFSCGSIFLSTKFPIEVWYPFSTESPIVICILYVIQVYIVIQSSLNFIVNFIFAMFFLYSSARLEMLCLKIQNAKNKRQINSCIEKHQKIIKFVDKTRHIAQYTLFKTNIMGALIIIFGLFPIIHKQSLLVSSQFILTIICASQRLFITAWTADDLNENSKQVAMEIYNIPWFVKSRYNIKDICFMIQRSQIPLEISIRGLMSLSLKYFVKYHMEMLSYFIAMRTIIDD